MKPYNEDPALDDVVCQALQEGLTPIEPSTALRGRILQRVRQATSSSGLTTIRAQTQDAWRTVAPGIEFKMLTYNPDHASKSFLLRAQPGTRMPPHGHNGYEECLVMEGEFCFGDLTLRAGDFHGADASVTHVDAYTENGVLVYLHVNIHDYPGMVP